MPEALIFASTVTHNMTTDCSVNQQLGAVYTNCFCFDIQINLCTQHVFPCSAKIRASDKDLPVSTIPTEFFLFDGCFLAILGLGPSVFAMAPGCKGCI